MVKRAAGALLQAIKIEGGGRRPISTQLYVALRDMILCGAFAAGERLPATRTAARELGVSRTTIIETFDRLTSDGLIESRIGSGTFVSAVLNSDRPKPPDKRLPSRDTKGFLSRVGSYHSWGVRGWQWRNGSPASALIHTIEDNAAGWHDCCWEKVVTFFCAFASQRTDTSGQLPTSESRMPAC